MHELAVAPGECLDVAQAAPAERALAPTALDYAGVAAAAAVWTSLVGSLAAWRHGEFLSHRFDLGNMVQAVWGTTQGRILEQTDASTGEQFVRLGGHVDPILVLFAPIWLAVPSPDALIYAYAGVIAAGVYPVFRLGLKYGGSRLVASLLGAWYLAIPWVMWIALNELNPSALMLPLLLFAIWFLDEERWGRFAIVVVLALTTGELAGLTIAALGLWYAVRRRRVGVGLAIAAAGAAWTAACLYVVVPAFNDGEGSRFYGRFESVGGSPSGLLETLVTDPAAIVSQMTTGGDLRYALLLAIPTGLLFLASPLLLVVAVPQLALNLLSDVPASVSPLYRYSAPVLAVLVVATVFAVGRVPDRLRVPVACIPLLLALLMLAAAPPVPGSEDYLFPERERAERRAAMREAVGLVPAGAPATATNRLGAHLSARRVIQLFPLQVGAEWAVLDTRDPSNSAQWFGEIPFAQRLARLRADPAWALVFEREGVLVFRRDGASDA